MTQKTIQLKSDWNFQPSGPARIYTPEELHMKLYNKSFSLVRLTDLSGNNRHLIAPHGDKLGCTCLSCLMLRNQ